MRIFLDANILFSAANSDGAIRDLLRMLVDQGHHLVADPFVVEEARRNLAAKSGGAAVAVLQTLLGVVEVAATAAAQPTEDQWLSWLPLKDRPVLAAASALACDVLVTGDRTHFGGGYEKEFGGVVIHSAASLARAVNRQTARPS